MKKNILILIFILGLVFFANQSVLAIAQRTEPIIIEDALRGQETFDTVSVFNSENEEVLFGLRAEGEIKDWMTFYKIDDSDLENPIDQVLVSAKSTVKAKVRFIVPDDTPNGEYSGEIVVMTMPQEKEETEGVSTSVRLRIGRQVAISVTDQENIEFDAAIIPEEYEIIKGEPLKVKVIYSNLGNVLIRPDIKLKIIKDEKVIHNAIYLYPEDEVAVKPRTERTLSFVEWQTSGQETGFYKAEVEVLLNDKVYQATDFRFSILSGSVLGISIGNFTINWWMMAIALLIIIVAIAIMVVKKRQKKIQI